MKTTFMLYNITEGYAYRHRKDIMQEKQNFKSLSSGLKEIIAEEKSQKRFDSLLQLLKEEKLDELKNFFLERVDLIDSVQLKALMLYTKLVSKEEIKKEDISIREIKPFLADALAKEIALIHKKGSHYKDLDFAKLNSLLPKLDTYLNDPDKSSNSKQVSYTLKLLETQNTFSTENFQDKLSNVYQEISELQNQASEESQINKETCFNANCCDCCIYTPPLVTKLEFEYIKANVNLDEFKIKAQENQKLHQAEFGTELGIIDLDKETKEAMNPNNFAHRCPFLTGDNACSIHDYRPFACRYYGLSTLDGKTVQACNYYLEQFQANNPEQRTVLDSRSSTALLGKANRELCDGKQLAGTLSAWLTQKGPAPLKS